MTEPIAYVHPGFVPLASAGVRLGDAGFFWGATVTDRLRTFDGRLFRVEDHLRRFRESCRLARVRLVLTDQRIIEVSAHLIDKNRTQSDLSLVWLATPGVKNGLATDLDERTPTFIAYTEKLIAVRARCLHREGARLRTNSAMHGVDARVKHRSRLAWWIALQEVHEQDHEAEPLFVEPFTGHVLETPTANLLAVLDGVVTSPPAGTILPGVSLGVVRELCQSLAIPAAERSLTLTELTNASEVFLTNTSYCIAGVSRIDDRPVPFPGPILNRLLEAWTDLVGVDVRPSGES